MRRLSWVLPPLLVLGACLGWTLLSSQFEFGRDHEQRPIPTFIFLYLCGWAGLVLGWRLVRARRESPPLLFYVIAVGIGARLLLLPSGLIQENDVYRYVLDGQVLLHGGNPYQYSPLVLESFASPELQRSLDTPEARLTLSRIGYPHVSTVYPPLTQAMFAAGAWLQGWDWRGQRTVFLGLDLVCMALLFLLLRGSGSTAPGLVLYSWNPLVLKEAANSAHSDVLTAVALAAFLYVLQGWSGGKPGLKDLRRASAAALCLAAAVLSKLYPLILVPMGLTSLWRRERSRRALLLFLLLLTLAVAAGVAPFLDIGWSRLTAGLRVYASEWVMNAGAFSLLEGLSRPRLLVAALAGAAALFFALRVPAGRLSAGLFWTLFVWFLFLPAVFPWYALPLVTLGAAQPQDKMVVSATLTVSCLMVLYYVWFLVDYRGYPAALWDWIRGLEHAVIWLSPLFPRLLNAGRQPAGG